MSENSVFTKKRKMFFSSFDQLKADLRVISGKDDFLSGDKTPGKYFRQQSWFRLIIQAIITLTVLVGGFFILISSIGDDIKKFVTGAMGTVIGYWLR